MKRQKNNQERKILNQETYLHFFYILNIQFDVFMEKNGTRWRDTQFDVLWKINDTRWRDTQFDVLN